MLGDEVERVTGIRPYALKLYGQIRHEAPHRIWMAFFTKASRPGFRVFDESGIMGNYKRNQSIDFFQSLQWSPSCGNWGSTTHAEDKYMAHTICRNCGGPHRSDSQKYLARLTRQEMSNKEQLKTFPSVGDSEDQAIARPRTAEAEAKAAVDTVNTLENTKDIMTSSLSPEDNTPCNSQASSVEDSTDDAMRL
ncbi:putative eka-like protein [Erysiphe necator]|uniref:Putative eka-like protein n=1 Tax=Uncinula necator TaxID=52586 RepID=A0A0B1P0V4_UNCNE|nr:putative eka-like protein [Erysiphe necator]